MWKVVFHPLVFREDLARLDRSAQQQILGAIEKKLPIDPKAYGKPLSGECAGLWRLRIGDYRAIYRIVEQRVEVLVLKIGIRRDFEVYQALLTRLRAPFKNLA
ncbi:MAG: type II toxin-antitoxin system RelE/ParE family toxin [Candidatus Omnitrophica bacterium]|nr:type II toxin-antitoxin system RelE/ParE family toxin [Candidatus Omnitrophota bacterium]